MLLAALPGAGWPGAAAGQPLVDRAAETGLDFVHFNGMSGELYFPEMTGAGAALLDYDGDGDLDAFLLQGHMLGGAPLAEATVPPTHPPPFVDRLYRNDLAAGEAGRPRFVDVTATSGLVSDGYGMGVATDDYDRDGWPDLYVTNFGANRLYRNNGDGTFSDVTAASGTGDPAWSVSAAFVDYDGDGWLDLYVGNYVDFRIATHKPCYSDTGARDYCGPLAYPPEPDTLYRNRGDGSFEDVSERAGIRLEPGAALGVVTADFNGDGRSDIYVANDGSANRLWLNQGDGTLRDEAVLGGCAVNLEGQPEASMGVVVGDFDGNGADDLFMAHLTRETNTLYLNDGSGLFDDRSRDSGLGAPSWGFTGFGTAVFDLDSDGWLDLFVANGAVTLIEELMRRGDRYPLHQTNQLFRNLGGGRFAEITAEAGEVMALSEVSRGVAAGDVDNDGDVDLLLSNNAGPARLLFNESPPAAWLGVVPLAQPPAADADATRIALRTAGGAVLWRRSGSGGSYASANDPRVTVGVGAAAPADLELRWPGARRQRRTSPPTGRYLVHRRPAGGAS